jgi:hypothetical protein
MSKVYIILRKEYEYDDVYYTESKGYELNSVYDNKEQAMNACQTLLLQDLKDNYSLEIALNDLHMTKEDFEELTKIIPEENLNCAVEGVNYLVWGIKGNFKYSELTDEELLKVAQIADFNPFDVMEKKVHGSSVLSR